MEDSEGLAGSARHVEDDNPMHICFFEARAYGLQMGTSHKGRIFVYLDVLILYDNMWDDGISLGPKEVHNYLTRVMYNRRS
ncbi:proteasome subunit beta type-4 isoform X1 [Tripterygium wilfordii]|uniref:Proteasome subunit beta type-4 isoform X1 n=1 Tax=Tripterygium wilfordii TaxID=458696 RepID=A0A7J7DGZ3_TRIWF|nr:proteasome subunit beta type-4 isoform X1 [Tripterygium wilfordii]